MPWKMTTAWSKLNQVINRDDFPRFGFQKKVAVYSQTLKNIPTFKRMLQSAESFIQSLAIFMGCLNTKLCPHMNPICITKSIPKGRHPLSLLFIIAEKKSLCTFSFVC